MSTASMSVRPSAEAADGLKIRVQGVRLSPWAPSYSEPFWANVDRSAGPSFCWPWRLARLKTGYGRIRVGRSVTGAHREAFRITRGYLPPAGLVVRHLCHNPPCCNPWHLESGSVWQNVHDSRVVGRLAHGARHARAKLTEAQVFEIREARVGWWKWKVPPAELAAKFGMTMGAICQVATGKTWRHLPAVTP